jgi:hypothetical protein
MAFANDCLDTIGTCPDNIPVVCTSQSVVERLTIKMYDPCNHQPIDLTVYDIPPTSSSSSSSSSSSGSEPPRHGVEIVIKESTYFIQQYHIMAAMPTTEEAKAGIVHWTPTEESVSKPGIFLGMALVWDHGVAKKQWPFYLDIRPRLDIYNIWNPGWPITVPEIRMAIRDTCPEVNFLIDKVEFEDHEVIWAIRQPVDQWNAVPPPVGTFTVADFPYRYYWLRAAIAELLRMAAIWMRRNDLDYSAGGVQVMDTKKWPDYLRLSDMLRKEWTDWMKQKKIEINLDGAYATLGGYKYNPYR